MQKLTHPGKQLSFILSVLCLVMACSLAQAQEMRSNLLRNGDFDEGATILGAKSLPGWRVLYGTVDVGANYPTPNGRNYLDLIGTPGVAAIEQSFPTVSRQKYVLSGWVAHHPGIPVASAEIFIDNQPLERLFHTGRVTEDNLQWTPFARTFVASCSMTTLRLADLNLAGYIFGGTLLNGLSIRAETAEGDLNCDLTICFREAATWRNELNYQRNRNYQVRIPNVNAGYSISVFTAMGVNLSVTSALDGYSFSVRAKLTAVYVAAPLSGQEQIYFWWSKIGTQKLGYHIRMPMNATSNCLFPVLLSYGEKLNSNSALPDLFNQTERALQEGSEDDLQILLGIYQQLNNCRKD